MPGTGIHRAAVSNFAVIHDIAYVKRLLQSFFILVKLIAAAFTEVPGKIVINVVVALQIDQVAGVLPDFSTFNGNPEGSGLRPEIGGHIVNKVYFVFPSSVTVAWYKAYS